MQPRRVADLVDQEGATTRYACAATLFFFVVIMSRRPFRLIPLPLLSSLDRRLARSSLSLSLTFSDIFYLALVSKALSEAPAPRRVAIALHDGGGGGGCVMRAILCVGEDQERRSKLPGDASGVQEEDGDEEGNEDAAKRLPRNLIGSRQ